MSRDAEMTLNLDVPQKVTVVSCYLTEGLSQLTHAKLEISCPEHVDLEGVLERDAIIDIAPDGFPSRRWTLRVGHIDFIRIAGGSLRYIVNLYPALWLLRFTVNTRKFRNMSAENIISAILDAHQIDHRFELMRQTETRKYCAQYRESNLDFIQRLLEFEGIYYSFEDDGMLVFADRSQDGEPTATQSFFELTEAAGSLTWDKAGIHQLYKGRKVVPGTATVNDYNWKKPAVPLLRSASADEDAELEVYEYPVGYRREDQGERLATTRKEAYRVPAKFVQGAGNVPSFAPGRVFTFGALANARFAGDYTLTEIRHEYVNRKFDENIQEIVEGVNYQNHFHAIPKGVPFRPPLITPHPHIAGCHTAMVVGPEGEEIHTDTHGRYRAKFHWDREAVGNDEDSRWLRNTQEVATGMVLARVGWEQSIAYINGDPDRPFGFARNINGQMVPEYGQPANKTRMTVKTPTYPGGGGFNELRLEDLAGSQHMDWKAERDMFGEVGQDRSEHIGGNESKKVGQSFAWTVGHNQDFQIGGNYECHVTGNHSLTVEVDRQKKVGADEEMKITEVFSLMVEGNEKEEVTGERKVLAAEKSGSITRQTETAWERKVTGDVQVEGEGNIEIIVQDDLTEEVGAAKTIEVEDGSIGVRVGGVCTMTVGATSTRESGQSMGYSANQTKIEVTGGATFAGDDKININGDRIILEANQLLSFKSKKLILKLEPGKTTIEGNMKIDAGNNIKVTGNKANITK